MAKMPEAQKIDSLIKKHEINWLLNGDKANGVPGLLDVIDAYAAAFSLIETLPNTKNESPLATTPEYYRKHLEALSVSLRTVERDQKPFKTGAEIVDNSASMHLHIENSLDFESTIFKELKNTMDHLKADKNPTNQAIIKKIMHARNTLDEFIDKHDTKGQRGVYLRTVEKQIRDYASEKSFNARHKDDLTLAEFPSKGGERWPSQYLAGAAAVAGILGAEVAMDRLRTEPKPKSPDNRHVQKAVGNEDPANRKNKSFIERANIDDSGPIQR